MRIALDSRFMQKVSQGTGTYTIELANNLISCINRDDKLLLLADDPSIVLTKQAGQPFLNDNRVEIKKLISGWTPMNLLGGFALAEWRNKCDLLHTNYLSPLVTTRSTKHVVTVHDVMFRTHKQYFNPKLTKGLEIFTPPSLQKADHIIAVSHYTKDEIIKNFGVNENKITVVHEAASKQFHVKEKVNSNDIIVSLGVTKPYFLFVGRFAAIKNIDSVITAFERLADADVQLVLVGGFDPAFPNPALENKIFNNPDKIKVLRGVSNEDLVHLYNNTLCLVFPSFAEGFGLPILEAMSCGAPVITSTAGSCPEIAGDAALLVNPNDLSQLVSAMENVFNDAQLRASLSEKGLKRADTFSWQRCATETYSVYENIIGKF
ncbi:glycosyltransferase family 4 protein [Serratia marcescens]|uniref:glycosyltransferase family 4 protein n=2 Tax=Serratia marcescens TaxID=615 RepID=UPI00098AEF1C|nr:glycosyltransferase family 1 protein [Serratia marcescens]AVE49255.1 glycosyltransferase family 1 protein [Serratia marcescens]MBH2974748.1 glycosyltransferase family 4 protein [Serratia marcescens]MBH2977643.1 glycosyltransferase family 4 protein [Serratia marcescens]MBN3985877.1 glycosyltransferase family 4 protein [Serratia marcescens]MBN5324368.1 glycosyltransferase family 4 protein [Serratia marcescens]